MSPLALSSEFFLAPAHEVAPKLLGCRLTTCVAGRITSGMIVEVEAYGGASDQACHAYRGPTQRTQVMFGAGGACYVYFIYGVHYCVNVVTGPVGEASAVLIRALEPLSGIEIMTKRRGGGATNALTNGPGKLCQALAIGRQMQGEHLLNSKLIWIESHQPVPAAQIARSKRIGISKSKSMRWRFFIRRNRWVSGS